MLLHLRCKLVIQRWKHQKIASWSFSTKLGARVRNTCLRTNVATHVLRKRTLRDMWNFQECRALTLQHLNTLTNGGSMKSTAWDSKKTSHFQEAWHHWQMLTTINTSYSYDRASHSLIQKRPKICTGPFHGWWICLPYYLNKTTRRIKNTLNLTSLRYKELAVKTELIQHQLLHTAYGWHVTLLKDDLLKGALKWTAESVKNLFRLTNYTLKAVMTLILPFYVR